MKKKKIIYSSIIAFLIILIISVSVFWGIKYYTHTKYFITEHTMEKILGDISTLEASLKTNVFRKKDKTNMYSKELLIILHNNHKNLNQFKYSLNYYINNPYILENLIKKVITNLEFKRSFIEKKLSNQ